MNIIYSKRLAKLCVLALAITTAMFGLQKAIVAKWAKSNRNRDDSANDILRQIAGKPFNEDSDVASLRIQVDRFRSLLGPGNTLETVVRNLGNAWAVEPGPVKHRNGFSVEISTFKRLSPAVADWQKVVGILGTLERLPGVGIVSFEMKTSGDWEHRKVELLEFIVELDSRSTVGAP